jgi:hypothetical protein
MLLGSAATAVGTLSGCVDLAQENTEEADNSSSSSPGVATNGTEQTQDENRAGNQTEAPESEENEGSELNDEKGREGTTDSEVDDETQKAIERVAENILAAFNSGEFDRMHSFIYPDSPTEEALEEFDETVLEQISEELNIELQTVTVEERRGDKIIAQTEVRYVESNEEDRLRSGKAELRVHESEWLIYSGDFLLPL